MKGRVLCSSLKSSFRASWSCLTNLSPVVRMATCSCKNHHKAWFFTELPSASGKPKMNYNTCWEKWTWNTEEWDHSAQELFGIYPSRGKITLRSHNRSEVLFLGLKSGKHTFISGRPGLPSDCVTLQTNEQTPPSQSLLKSELVYLPRTKP